MTRRRASALTVALVAALTGPALAEMGACIGGDSGLHAALSQSLANDAALLIDRGVQVPEIQLTPTELVALFAQAFALTPQHESLLIYSQTDAGLCALVFDGSSVITHAQRPGQTAADLTAARLDLSAALKVEARQLERSGTLRGAAVLDDAPPALDPVVAARLLADRLMLPDLAKALRNADEILVLPTNDIGTVPFALLPLGGAQVIDAAPVTIAPSPAALVQSPDLLLPGLASLQTTGPGFTPVWTGAAVIGDPAATDDPEWNFPPLPGARAEAKAIASRFAATPLIGEAATPDAVLAALNQPVDLVYFAAHGVSSGDAPLTHSFLALAGGRLTAGEVQTLRLPNRPLVVLSACQTGLGRSHAGGTIGLARAFVLAGASAVVSTLWNVNDAATEDLMRDFSANLSAMRPADALRAAMLTARDRHPDDPALWAGVMLLGGPSVLVP